MENIPNNPNPRNDGNCKNNNYIYSVASSNNNYTLSFCLGGDVSQIKAGVNLKTPLGMGNENLVGYWKFNETSGTTTDDATGNGNTRTMYANLTPAYLLTNSSCVSDNCANFGTSNDRISLSSSTQADVVGDITITFWINIPDGNCRIPIHKDSQYTIEICPPIFYWADSSNYNYSNFGAQNLNITTNSWQFLAVTKTGGVVTVYRKDNSTYTTFSKIFVGNPPRDDGRLTSMGSKMTIGCYGDFNNGQCVISSSVSFKMDNVRVYNRALSESEVLAIYESEK